MVSPDPDTPYHIRRGAPLADQRIPLTARASAASATLYWYQDGGLVAAAPPPTASPHPRRRRPHLVVADDPGRSDGLTSGWSQDRPPAEQPARVPSGTGRSGTASAGVTPSA